MDKPTNTAVITAIAKRAGEQADEAQAIADAFQAAADRARFTPDECVTAAEAVTVARLIQGYKTTDAADAILRAAGCFIRSN